MSFKIDPREVLEYLNELGYQHITAEMLKNFIKDLKKLVKYEQKIKQHSERANIENIPPKKNDFLDQTKPHKSSNSDFYKSLHETVTVASRAKEVQKNEKVISIQIKKPLHEKQSYVKTQDKDIQYDKNELNKISKTISTVNTLSSLGSKGGENDRSKETVSSGKSKSKSRCGSTLTSSAYTVQPKSSFIKPRIELRKHKSDPVALYHYYQNEWKRLKIPGEDNRYDLRWAIREKMLSGPTKN